MTECNGPFSTQDVWHLYHDKVVFLDGYWACKDGDIAKAVYYKQNPMVHRRLDVAKRMARMVENRTGWKVVVVYVPIAFRPLNLKECPEPTSHQD